jgi:hypothetical protein
MLSDDDDSRGCELRVRRDRLAGFSLMRDIPNVNVAAFLNRCQLLVPRRFQDTLAAPTGRRCLAD